MKKHLLLAGLLLVVMTGCEKDSIKGDMVLEVGDFDPADFVIERYYTYIDTFDMHSPMPTLMIASGEDFSLQWEISQAGRPTIYCDNRSEVVLSTLTGNQPALPAGFHFSEGQTVVALVSIDGETITRRREITEIRHHTHIFGLEFGMNIEQVTDLETKRFAQSHLRFQSVIDGSDGWYMMWESGRLNVAPTAITATLYHFTDGKLDEVGEFIYDPLALSPVLIDYCRALGLSEPVGTTQSYYIDKLYFWEDQHLSYVLSEAPIPFGYDHLGKQTFTGVYYSPKAATP